jgi:hypothetical protein
MWLMVADDATNDISNKQTAIGSMSKDGETLAQG